MRRVTVGLLALVTAAGVASPLSGVTANPILVQDTSWLAWLGCWEGTAEVGGNEADAFVVCFEPAAGTDGVQIRTYTDGDLVAVEEMLADGNARRLDEGGCVGERTASWSRDGARVFLVSEMACGEGVTRSTSGVLSMLPGGEGWLEIQAVRAGDEDPLMGIRSFTPADEAALEADGIPDPTIGRELAIRTARSRAGASLSPEALVETVENAGPNVTSALLLERGEPFGLDAETMQALAERGVPGEVLDVMVAVSYPERFEIGGAGEPEIRAATATQRAASGAWPRRRAFRGYSPWGLGYDLYWDPFWSSAYRFGYGAFGYYPYGGGLYGRSFYRPRLIFAAPPVVRSRSTLSRERGIVSDDGGSVRSSRRRSQGSSASPSRPLSRSGGASARPSRSSSSSGGSSRAAPSSSSRGGSGSARTARPRGGAND